MSLLEFLRTVYAPLAGISDRTIRIYEFTLTAWRKFLGREPMLADLEELAVATFLAHRLRERSVGTAAKDRAQIRAIWEMARRRDAVSTWPVIRRIRVPERVPQAWLTDEMQRLLAAAGQREGTISGVPASAFWRACLLTLYEVGERIDALLHLEWKDVTPQGITFRAETRKGRTRDIWRPISSECYAAIDAIRGDRKYVFAWDRCYTNLWRHLGKICEAAGLPNDRSSKFHRVRKTHASYAAAAGLDATKLLDHASPSTTKAYLDPRIVTPQSAPSVLPKVS